MINMTESTKTEAEAIASMVKDAAGVTLGVVQDPMTGIQIPLVAVPGHMKTVDFSAALEARLPNPRRKTGTVTAESLDALIDLVNRQKTEATVIYVSECGDEEGDGADDPSIVAVLNDHFNTEGVAGHRDHRVVYRPMLSKEWELWNASDGKSFGQANFAGFLEDHLLDLANPSDMGPSTRAIVEALGVTVADPATVRGLARDFSVRAKSQIKEAVNLQSGETQIVFASAHETDAGQPVNVPGAFLISIPVFHLGTKFLFVARLRYRADGGISWHYRLAHTDRALRLALEDQIEALRTKCPGVLVVEGKP